jgi:hypothetical protein
MRVDRIRAHLLRHRVDQHCRCIRRGIVRRLATVVECAHVARVHLGVVGAAVGVVALRRRHLRVLEQLHAAQAGVFVDVAGAPATVNPETFLAVHIHHHVAAINDAWDCFAREKQTKKSRIINCSRPWTRYFWRFRGLVRAGIKIPRAIIRQVETQVNSPLKCCRPFDKFFLLL